MDTFLRVYVPTFYLAFIALVFVIPSVRLYRRTTINPFRFATRHNAAHDYVGNSMKLFILILFIAVGVFSVSSSAYQWLVPFSYLESTVLKISGLVMLHISLVGIRIAQRGMRLSWRIGIDFEHKTALVTTGLFAVSRNPVYFFLLMALIGIFLLLPNAITFAVLFAAYLVLNITMRMEEDFLASQRGQEYLDYKSKVRRLI